MVDASVFTDKEHLFGDLFYKNVREVENILINLWDDFALRLGKQSLNQKTLSRWVNKGFATGSVLDAPKSWGPIAHVETCVSAEESIQRSPIVNV